MTKTTHTPGPWENDWQFIVAPDPSGVHPDIYIAEIAESDEDGRVANPEQQQANARLIAAAPDLLRSAESAMQALHREYDKYCKGQWHDPDCRDAYINLRDAVDAAKGDAI